MIVVAVVVMMRKRNQKIKMKRVKKMTKDQLITDNFAIYNSDCMEVILILVVRLLVMFLELLTLSDGLKLNIAMVIRNRNKSIFPGF